jgi:hypothetical protein
LLSLVVSLAIAFLPQAHAQSAHSAGRLPTSGVLVPGVSLAGVKIGMSQTQVKAVLGNNVYECTTDVTLLCKEPTWLFEYTHGEPLGLAVKFHSVKGGTPKVSAVFTLGAIEGWKTREGLKIGDPVSNIYSFYATPIDTLCVGFEALSARQGTVTTSFYTADGIVYGFALTTPPEKVCQ